MKLKSGKDEIEYLLAQVFKKYEAETGNKLNLNTNRRNYEDLARMLSAITKELPYTAEKLGHNPYPEDRSSSKAEYPYLKYDITGGQIKDAFNGLVAKPRPYLVDACYIYLYGVGRNRFEENITDPNLIENGFYSPSGKSKTILSNKYAYVILALCVLLGFALFKWMTAEEKVATIKKDLMIMPYQPSQAEIDSLEGVWMVYIGSPQARKSDKNRFHKFVRNVITVKYKNGYFLFNRYGAGFDHYGYMQYETPEIVSVHSYLKNSDDKVESPRLSLMRLQKHDGNKIMVISASWNFDAGNNNDIIGIREVYIKQGKGGDIKEVINTVDNHACNCKILLWSDGKKKTHFYLRNESLDSLSNNSLKSLLNENSILLRTPDSVTILKSNH